MYSVLFAWLIGILLFALAGEADTAFLQVVGTVAAGWFVLIGAISGWQWAQRR